MKKNFIFETLLIIFLGSLTSLSLPPYNFFFLNFFTFSVLFIFLFQRLKQGIKKSFYYGWLFGFSYFLSSLYWLTISLSFDQSFNYMNKPKNLDNYEFKIKTIKIFIHGFLHLLGHDHQKSKEYKQMLNEEKKIFKFVEKTSILN